MVSVCEVANFKSMTDENRLIASIVKNDFADFLPEPILDVGSGLGDIPTKALYKNKVILTDINEIDAYRFSPNHIFVRIDFFDLDGDFFSLHGFPKTLLISHTLQYIDSDIEKLREKINFVNPRKILLVTNDNTSDMKHIINFFVEKLPFIEINPEYPEVGFLPNKYVLEKIVKFESKVVCDNFDDLVVQVAYLMDCTLDNNNFQTLLAFLKSLLSSPSLTIHQSIRLFEKVD